ncbi:DNA topoisomerase I, mitochondrial [Lissotriton helveticus]
MTENEASTAKTSLRNSQEDCSKDNSPFLLDQSLDRKRKIFNDCVEAEIKKPREETKCIEKQLTPVDEQTVTQQTKSSNEPGYRISNPRTDVKIPGYHDVKMEQEKIRASEREKEISIKSDKSKKNEEKSSEKRAAAELKHQTGKTEKLMEKAIINGKQKNIEKEREHGNPKEKSEMVKHCRNSKETGVNKRGEIEAFHDKGPKKRIPADKRKIIEYDDLFKPDVLVKTDKVCIILKSNTENKKESKESEKESLEYRNKINSEQHQKNENKIKQNKERLEVKVREGNQHINGKHDRKDLDEKYIIDQEKTEPLIKGDLKNMGSEEESMSDRDALEMGGERPPMNVRENICEKNKMEFSSENKARPSNAKQVKQGEQEMEKQIDEERIDWKVEVEVSEAHQVCEEQENGRNTCTSTIDYQYVPGGNCRAGEKPQYKPNEIGKSEENQFNGETMKCEDPERGKNDPDTPVTKSEQMCQQKAALGQNSKEKRNHKERGEKKSKKDKRELHDQGPERAKNLSKTGNHSNALKEKEKKRHKRKEVDEKEATRKHKDKESKDNRSKEIGDEIINNYNPAGGSPNLLKDRENTGKGIGARNENECQIEDDKDLEERKECTRKDEKKDNECDVTEMEERSGRLNHERCNLNEEENNEIKDEFGKASLPNESVKEEQMEEEINASEKIEIKCKDQKKGENRSEEEQNEEESELKLKEKKKKKKNKEKEKTNKIPKETKSKTHQKLKVKLSYEMDKKRKKKRDKDDQEPKKKDKNEMDVNHEGKMKREKESENISRKRKIKEDGDVKVKKSKTEESTKVKKAQEEQKWKWWEEENYEDGVKWKFLEHKGPYFAPPYEPLPEDVNFYYDGKPMKLSLATEEVATFYGKMIDHEYTTKKIFQRNFFYDWTEIMTEEEKKVITDLDKCNFTQIHKYFFEKNEARKALPKEEKQILKLEADKITQEYGFCTLDGHREKIGNFKTEPPGLFRGRGDHPKMGMLKKRIMPKDVIINCSKESKIPEPPEGHKWKEVRCDNTVTWLASWTENIQGSIKYIMLNPSSKLKGEKDWQKYEVARRLKDVVDKIRKQYRADFKAREMKTRQRAVALYFIDKLALRAGNEKEEGETADTVGCCSLRVEHIKLHPKLDGQEYVVEFDFLGKDSIRYYNKVPVLKEVFKNLYRFLENKEPGDDLFDRLNTTSVNKHLQDLMDGLTAKVFRTYNASITLQEQLKALTNEDDNVAAKILSYNRANRAVALLCNHQRALPKTYEKSMQTLQAKIDAKKEQLSEAKKELKKAKAELKERDNEKSRKEVDKKKKLRERLEEQLMKLKLQATDKEENKQIALGTSKLNYLDPRITVAWCKKFGVPIEKIYNKTQRDKFAWAIDMTDENFEF